MSAVQHPDYMGVWCPTCKEDCLPIHGKCGFCDTRVIDAQPPTSTPPIQEDEPVPPACKHAGCERPAQDRRGMYAGLCATHKAEKRAARVPVKRQAAPVSIVPPPEPAPLAPVAPIVSNGNGHAKLSLTELAQAVEQAKASLDESVAALRDALEAV